ncbi:MAG: hypothetical protein H0W50_06090 [Parachlamydiaceae bacterium]|nr:hypothetical protein [Parachlamydiaceae bacterium]
MSWMLNYYSERVPQNDNVIAKLRLATKKEAEEEFVGMSEIWPKFEILLSI